MDCLQSAKSIRCCTPPLMFEKCINIEHILSEMPGKWQKRQQKKEGSKVILLMQLYLLCTFQSYGNYSNIPVIKFLLSGQFVLKCGELTFVIFWNSWIWCGNYSWALFSVSWINLKNNAYAVILIAGMKTNIQVAISLKFDLISHKVRGSK